MANWERSGGCNMLSNEVPHGGEKPHPYGRLIEEHDESGLHSSASHFALHKVSHTDEH